MSDWTALAGAVEAKPERERGRARRPGLSPLGGAALLLVLFLAVPLVALVWRALGEPGVWAAAGQPLVVRALRLSVVTTAITIAVAVVAGTPLAYLLARRRFRGKRLVEVVIDLPLVLPPVVAGVALLMAFGRRGLLGDALGAVGIELPFTTAAVVLAQVFVSVPFYVRGARAGFQAVPVELEEAAAIDGASTWHTLRRVTLPLALPGVASGLVLCWARALSEFGATLMFAGNFTGRTQTMPLAIMSAMERDLDAALALSVLLLAVAAVVLILARLVAGRRVEP